ncbi:helix-turn-helix protein [Stackebrandtia albiflava]|uniref:Helix-turn-helix protein n=1 Tax=Stackebrandtia albiflava TaxID=406432 RepID=A0A562UYD8_9ACTN|nr:winged helix-turn-helix domain-containing protein [Stackebrandtia albiflava]TWJ10654.1 helix-turn-helix protein [Stackebrandtia albiflava]
MREDKPAATEAEAKALASGLRMRILRLCLDEALTNKEIADRLDMNPATVLHHVRTLVSTGFLAARPARTGRRGAREIPYLATRKSWRVDVGAHHSAGLSSAMIEAFIAELPHDLTGTDGGMWRLGLRLTDEERAELHARLQRLFDEYADRPNVAGARPYALFTSLQPDSGRD